MAIVSHRKNILHSSLYLERRDSIASFLSSHLRERKLVDLNVFVSQHIEDMHREIHAKNFEYNDNMFDLESCTFSSDCEYSQFDT